MEFQQYLDPFGSALKMAGMRLQNEGKSIANENAMLDLGIKKEQMEDEKKSREMTMKVWANRPPPGTQGAMALMGLAGAAPAEGAKEEGEGEGGTRTAGGGERDPYTGLMATYSQDRNFNLQQSQAAYLRHDYAGSEKYSKLAEEATKNYGEALEKRTQYHKAVMGDLNRVFASVNDPGSLGTAVQEMQELHPEWKPESLKQFGIKFDRGVPVFDKKKIDDMAHMALTVKDQAEIAYKQAELKLSGERNRIAEERARQSARRADQMALSHRDTVLDREDKRRDAYVEKEKKSLHQEPVYKDFDKYENAISTAVSAQEKLDSKGGYSAFTTADAAFLTSQANAMRQGFRYRTEGAKAMEQMHKLDGALRSMERWTTSIGEGDKQVAYKTAKELIASMQGVYDERNVAVNRETLKRVQQVVKKGGDVDALEPKGDLNDLLRKGLARRVEQEGKVYIELQNPATRKFSERYMIKDLTRGDDE